MIKLLALLLFTASCTQMTWKQKKVLELYDFPPRLEAGVASEAFSGLLFSGFNSDGSLSFWTHTDRGPNAEPLKDLRPFVLPQFQPRLTKFHIKPGSSLAEYDQTIYLRLPNGRPMSGLPNVAPSAQQVGDETPVNLAMEVLALDPMGIDPEGLCVLGDEFYLVEEYGPSLLRFDQTGQLITRYLPRGRSAGPIPEYVKELLPTQLLTRKMNRGFEGIACAEGKIYLAIQSPLPLDGKNILMTEFDPKSESVTKTFFYPLDSMNADKIGDLAYANGKLLVLEQNSKTGPDSFHRIYSLKLADLTHNAVGRKDLVIDLVKAGYDFAEKVEGLAVIDEQHIAVVNDNDFALTGAIDVDKRLPVVDFERKSRLGIIKLPTGE